jgi:hypothetical protein
MDQDGKVKLQQVDVQNISFLAILLKPQRFREVFHGVGGMQEWRNADKLL